MSAEAELVLLVAADANGIVSMMGAVRQFVHDQDLAAEAANDVMVIVDELATNMVRHAWPSGGAHSFELSLATTGADAQREIVIGLTDDGIPFDPTQAPDPVVDTPLQARQEGNLGLMLVRAMSDRLEYQRDAGRNRVRVIKSIPDRRGSGD